MKINVEARPNTYGFGQDWTLVVSKEPTGTVKRFWLGQDCKVCSRCLGIDIRDLGKIIKKIFNTDAVYFDREDINTWLGKVILLSSYGIEFVFDEHLDDYMKGIEKDIFGRKEWEFAIQ